MKVQQDHATPPHSSPREGQRRSDDRSQGLVVPARFQGPGGLYNLGNLTALGGGLAVQFVSAPDDEGLGPLVAVHLFGSPGAGWLTAAMMVFLTAGEAYHRAWAGRTRPVDRLNRLGDLLSAAGAVCLTAALVQIGDAALAGAAGVLLAGGKLGTALLPAEWTLTARAFRSLVVASRLPCIAALLMELYWLAARGSPASDAFLPGVTLLRFVLCLSADILLLRGHRAAAPIPTISSRLEPTQEFIGGRTG